jgi:histidinol dehydrogenase
MVMKIHNWSDLDANQRRALLTRPVIRDDASLRPAVSAIVERVRRERDAALRVLTEQFDGVKLEQLEVGAAEKDRAAAALTAAQRDAIRAAAANIETFHAAQRPAELDLETMPGVRCERVIRPIGRVGLYVPAGNAPLPSTVLMLAIPARIAGCPTRIICSPPDRAGQVNPAVLYAAQVCGVERVFRVGGAQAIAAMAYGTETIPKVDKVFGPGSRWVTAAKSLVADDPLGCARDLPAGPSEVMVIADAYANPAFVAADLLSQAEHDEDSQVVLVTTSAAFADAVVSELGLQRERLSRQSIVDAALANSSAILVDTLATAIEISNRYAPEHLILQVREPRQWVGEIHNAGSVFLGPWAPESVGDYCSGTNHVLPTYGFARNYSGLNLNDFLRSMTIQELSPAGIARLGPIATTLAELEGLDAHANAVALRLGALRDGGEP